MRFSVYEMMPIWALRYFKRKMSTNFLLSTINIIIIIIIIISLLW